MNRGTLLALFLTLLLFVVSGFFASVYEDTLLALPLRSTWWGTLVYIGIVTVSIVAAPLSSFPLLPIAVTLWGPLLAAVLSIVGWTLGATIAYAIARHVGRPLLVRFTNMSRIDALSHAVVGNHTFWSVVLLRMIVPVDVLSYTLGLFVPMRLSRYVWATLIGVSPFGFVFAYAADARGIAQIIALGGVLVFVLYVYRRLRLFGRSGTIQEG